MTNAGKVRGFLDFSGPDGWDPSLMGVMAGAVGFNLVSFRLLRHWEVTPVCLPASASSSSSAASAPSEQALHKSMKYGAAPENLVVNWRLVLGASIFGVGWGMGGESSQVQLLLYCVALSCALSLPPLPISQLLCPLSTRTCGYIMTASDPFVSFSLCLCLSLCLSLSLCLYHATPGLCPGPSLVQLGTHSPLAQVYMPAMLLGMAAQELLMN